MVFNTGMTGYQETLTDPSYARQIVAMTAPHIGNTGVNDTDPESRQIWVSGYVVREPARLASSWRAQRSLQDELAAQGITGIAMQGTRALTRHLRDQGAMRAGISAGTADPAELLERVLASPQMTGADLAREVSTPEPYVVRPPAATPVRYRVAAVDLGIKAATPRSMAALGCEVHVLPATATAAEILAASPDGVFFSNGPGDPAAIGYAVDAMRGVLAAGRRSSASASAARCSAGRSALAPTSCGSAIAASTSLCRTCAPARCRSPATTTASRWSCPAPAAGDRELGGGVFETDFGPAQITHLNLNDGVVEGLRLLEAPAFSVQYHPEAAPGPHDASGLFTEFCELMEGPMTGRERGRQTARRGPRRGSLGLCGAHA